MLQLKGLSGGEQRRGMESDASGKVKEVYGSYMPPEPMLSKRIHFAQTRRRCKTMDWKINFMRSTTKGRGLLFRVRKALA